MSCSAADVHSIFDPLVGHDVTTDVLAALPPEQAFQTLERMAHQHEHDPSEGRRAILEWDDPALSSESGGRNAGGSVAAESSHGGRSGGSSSSSTSATTHPDKTDVQISAAQRNLMETPVSVGPLAIWEARRMNRALINVMPLALDEVSLLDEILIRQAALVADVLGAFTAMYEWFSLHPSAPMSPSSPSAPPEVSVASSDPATSPHASAAHASASEPHSHHGEAHSPPPPPPASSQIPTPIVLDGSEWTLKLLLIQNQEAVQRQTLTRQQDRDWKSLLDAAHTERIIYRNRAREAAKQLQSSSPHYDLHQHDRHHPCISSFSFSSLYSNFWLTSPVRKALIREDRQPKWKGVFEVLNRLPIGRNPGNAVGGVSQHDAMRQAILVQFISALSDFTTECNMFHHQYRRLSSAHLAKQLGIKSVEFLVSNPTETNLPAFFTADPLFLHLQQTAGAGLESTDFDAIPPLPVHVRSLVRAALGFRSEEEGNGDPETDHAGLEDLVFTPPFHSLESKVETRVKDELFLLGESGSLQPLVRQAGLYPHLLIASRLAPLLVRYRYLSLARSNWSAPIIQAASLDDATSATLQLLSRFVHHSPQSSEQLLRDVMDMIDRRSTTGLASCIWDFIGSSLPVPAGGISATDPRQWASRVAVPMHPHMPADVFGVVCSFLPKRWATILNLVCYHWYDYIQANPNAFSIAGESRRKKKPHRNVTAEDGEGEGEDADTREASGHHRRRGKVRSQMRVQVDKSGKSARDYYDYYEG